MTKDEFQKAVDDVITDCIRNDYSFGSYARKVTDAVWPVLEAAEKEESERLLALAHDQNNELIRLREEGRTLRAEIEELYKEADKFDDGIDWIQRALQAEAKIEQMERQEPDVWMQSTHLSSFKNRLCGSQSSYVHCSDHQLHPDFKPLYALPCTQPESSIPEGWLRAIDEALVVAHIGVANKSDTYEQAREKLNNLIGFHVDVATDPAVNGGYKLVLVRLKPKNKGTKNDI